jgi:ABC-type branched-subunit amino acid transport system substrate-binding protein
MANKIILGLLGAIILALLIIAITPQTTGLFGLKENENTYTIGIILPITGQFANYGEHALNSIKLSLKENPNIRIILEDDMGDNARAASAAYKLIELDKVDALITYRSTISAVITSIAQETKTPLIYSSSITAPAKNNSYAFVNYLNVEQDCFELAKLLKGKKGALVGFNFEATQECINGFKRNEMDLDVQFILQENQDYKTQITKALSKNPDFLVLRGDEKKATPHILKQIKELNYSGFQIICPNTYAAGCNNEEMLEEYQNYFMDSIGTGAYLAKTKEIKEFEEKYNSDFNKSPGEWSYATYENIKILSEALNYCKGEKECVRDYIATHEFNGLEGKIKFNNERIIEKTTNVVTFDGTSWAKRN